MVAISTTSKGKVLFCIVDTGADLNNTDLKAQSELATAGKQQWRTFVKNEPRRTHGSPTKRS